MIHLCYHKRTLRKMYYEIFKLLPQETNYMDGVSLKLFQIHNTGILLIHVIKV
jgi:hypothetical protein